MKKCFAIILSIALTISLAGCFFQPRENEIVETFTTELATYYKMSDGTWQCDGHTYKYRVVINGTMPNAKASSTFVYLSNVKNIPFARAYRAAGISSNLDDYFAVEEAVLVDWITE